MMRSAAAETMIDPRFDLPPHFVVAERRMAGQAIDEWRAGGKSIVPGFDSHSLIIVDPAGVPVIADAGAAISAAFGLAPGMRLDGPGGLFAEVRAACDLIAIDPQPVPFELRLTTAKALILARGVALPIWLGMIPAEPGRKPDRVQVVVNWREVLDRRATTQLRRELGASLRVVPAILARNDPFSVKTGG
jgi:hypothetical protein